VFFSYEHRRSMEKELMIPWLNFLFMLVFDESQLETIVHRC
jgi:hypothetical protein